MKCIDKQILLDYLNDELSSRKKKKIASHISACTHCRAQLEEWQKVLSVTQQYVDRDIHAHPVPAHAHITRRFQKVVEKNRPQFWTLSWAKPALAAVVVLFAVLMIVFVNSRSTQPVSDNYFVIDNISYTETVALNQDYLDVLVTGYLQEIYEDEELIDDILYGDWQYYDEVLDDLDEEEFDELINNMFNGVT